MEANTYRPYKPFHSNSIRGAPGRIRTADPQIRSLMDDRTPRSRSPYARGFRSLPARGHPIERRGPSRPNAIVSAIDGGLTNSAAVQDRRDERPVVSTLVHARILDIRWTHPANLELTY